MNKCHYLLLLFVVLLSSNLNAQPYPENCPSYPATDYFDPNCYMYLGEIQLGQGRIKADDYGAFWGGAAREVYIPCNRPDWAIASLHGWQLMRNVLGQEYYDKHVFLATALQESFWNCDPTLDWDCYKTNPTDYPDFDDTYSFDGVNGEYTGVYQNDGCFHLSPPGYLWLKEYMPHRHTTPTFDTYVAGNNFIRGVISKTHYDLLAVRFYQQGNKGADPLGLFAQANDEFAADVWNARHFNMGYGAAGVEAVLQPANRANSIAIADFVDADPAFQYTYPYSIKRTSQVLANKYTGGQPDNEWHNWYDHDITWPIMSAYMDEVFVMYPEILAAAQNTMKAEVQAIFDQQDVDNNGIVSFRYEFGPVLDAFILAMPYDDPMETMLNTQSGYGGCSGCVGPVVKVKANTPVEICKGLKVELETVVGNGYTYEWLLDGSTVTNANTQQHIFYAEVTGEYSVIVTTSSGCSIEAECPVPIIVNDCSSCDLVATVSSTSNSCSGIADGEVVVALSGNDYNSSLTYEYEWTIDGVTSTSNSGTKSNSKEGSYGIKVIDPNDATCNASNFIKLEENVKLYHDVTLQSTVTACDKADLKAEITGNPPATCTYGIRIESGQSPNAQGKYPGGTWPNTESNTKIKINGVTALDLGTVTATWGPLVYHQSTFDVSKGDQIDVVFHAIKQGANVNLLKYDGTSHFNMILIDAEGNETVVGMTDYTSPAQHTIISEVATCKQPKPAFDFVWVPNTNISTPVETDTTSITQGTVGAETKFIVEATSTSYPTCVLRDTVKVPFTCVVTCSKPQPTINWSNSAVEFCAGDQEDVTGTIVTTGLGDLYYQWFDGTTALGQDTLFVKGTTKSIQLPVTSAGSYIVRVAETKLGLSNPACYYESSAVVVTEKTAPTFTVAPLSSFCGDASLSDLNSFVSGLNPVNASLKLYSDLAGTTEVTASNVTITSDFYIQATDGDCKSSLQTVTITIVDKPDLVLSSISECTKVDLTDAAILIASSNLTGTIMTYWDDTSTVGNQLSDAANVVVSGKYYIKTDNNGCSDEASIDVTIGNGVTIKNDLSSTSLFCEGAGLNLEVLATGVVSYQWKKDNVDIASATTSVHKIASLSTSDNGVYKLEMIGGCGTATSQELTVSVIEAIQIDKQPVDVASCVGGNVNFEITLLQGGGILIYDWFKGGTSLGVNSNVLNLTNVSAVDQGTYKVNVTNSCQTVPVESNVANLSITANEIPKVNLAVNKMILCEDEVLIFTATPVQGQGSAPEYEFFDANTNAVLQTKSTSPTYQITTLNTGIYDVFVKMTSNSTCIAPSEPNPVSSIAVSVQVDELPSQANIIDVDKIICSEGKVITANVPTIGIGSWSIGNGVGMLSNETVTTTELILANGEVSEVVFTVSNGTCPSTTDKVTITRSGTLTPATVVLKDKNTPQSILVAPYLLCENSMYELVGATPKGDETATWKVNNSNVTVGTTATTDLTTVSNGMSELSYIITNTNDATCADTIKISVNVTVAPSALNQNIDATSTVLCEGESATFSLQALTSGTAENYKWAWPDGTESITNNPSVIMKSDTMMTSGNLTVTPLNDCGVGISSNTLALQINPKSIPKLSISNNSFIQCKESLIDITAQATGAGVNPTITITTSIAFTETVIDNETTEYQFSALEKSGAITFNLIPEQPGCYDLTGAEELIQYAQVTIVEPTVVSITPVSKVVCLGSPTTIYIDVINKGGTPVYEWYENGSLVSASNSYTHNGNADAVISLKVKEDAVCGGGMVDATNVSTITVSGVETPQFNLEENKVFCREELEEGVVLQVINAGGNTVTWMQNNETVSSENESLILPNDLVAEVELEAKIDDGFCEMSSVYSFLVDELEVDLLVSSSAIEIGQNVEFEGIVTNGSGQYTYVWLTEFQGVLPQNSSVFNYSPLLTDSYQVQVKDNQTECEIVSSIEEVIVYLPIEIPNAFTPNGDGINDTWTIEGLEEYEKTSVIVYNRWGVKVFEANRGSFESWDGVGLKGEMLPVATYYYVVKLGENEAETHRGDITIIR